MRNKTVSLAAIGAAGFFAIVIAFMTFGINDNGYRTVVQLPSGKTFVKHEPGIYFDWFGTATRYPDVITYSFDGETGNEGSLFGGSDESGLTVGNGVDVRYQDGGKGALYGVARFSLPNSEEEMLKLHRAFRTEAGVRDKLIQPVVRETLNLTAGLMTSEEAYAEKRNEFLEWSEDQVRGGNYLTNIEERTQIVEPEERDAAGNIIKRAVTRIQDIPVVRRDPTGNPVRGQSQLVDYGIIVTGFDLTDWGFEPRTLEQIQQKRAAEMAIITSQADAAKANQQRLQAIAEGQRDVAEAEYREKVKEAEAIVIAQREAEVARINAARQVAVNEQRYLAQIQDVLAAEQEAKAVELRSTAEADARRRILEADGALERKLDVYTEVMKTFAEQFAKQKWTPEIVMGANASNEGGNAAAEMIDLLTTQTARNLALDLSLPAPVTRRVSER